MSNEATTALLVDDDIDFLEQTRIRLEAAGFAVTSACSRKAAEEILASMQPDIAIVDLMMENTDGGFALCDHIESKAPSIPMIRVTPVASETGLECDAATEEERSRVKADVVLAEPVRFEQSAREIDRLLKR